MYAFLMFVHVVVCLFLVVVVLLQPGRGGIGPAMGGGNQVFGGGGAGNVLTKATTAFAGIFMITSISLAVLKQRQASLLDSIPAAVASPTPAAGPSTVLITVATAP